VRFDVSFEPLRVRARCYHRCTMHTLHFERPREQSRPRQPRFRAIVALGLGACWLLPAAALQPLVTDDTETQERGGNQLEISVQRERLRSPADRTTALSLPLVYTRGLTESFEAYIELRRERLRSSAADKSARGNGNPAVGFKWRFWENEAQEFSLALKPELQFGVSREAERHDLGNGRAGYAATLIASKETSFGAIHANASVNRMGYDLVETRTSNRRTLYRLSVAPVVTLSPAWKAAIDVGVTTNPDRARRARMGYVELGAIWSPHDDVELAFGIIRQIGDGEPTSQTLSAGLTWRF
jgi:hypothetical protein